MCVGWFSGTSIQISSGKWGIVWEWDVPNRKIACSQYRGSKHGIGCHMRLLEQTILSPVPGKKLYCCVLCFFVVHVCSLQGRIGLLKSKPIVNMITYPAII